ncbi:DUF6712 family protein [Flavobacterium taihuense]|uniref:Uncharacterized protein n=1 Tax=Flavobacterium taihuense TaxID=2857508 RepID=A0ABS6Y0N4_9FLAO|nr:DUF6712 family protein [Flavobacterium taihuense]MBW4362488.1 hypothetical protein [Flavobacterium taihuense]
MKLLFTTTGTTGNTELKELMGFIDADLKLKNLIPDLITATNDVIDLVGEEVYKKAIEAFNNGTIAEEDKDFIYAVRYPIAVNAYRLFSPTNDLAHTNNGRKMRQDENEKQAFEWLLDKDNAAMEKRYYRALDDLIKFLDRSKIEVETPTSLYTIWTTSDAFKATHDLFIRTVSDFDKVFPLQSRLLLIKLAPGISDCEQYEIRPRVGTEKLDALKLALRENTPIADAKDLELIRLIRKASVAYSFAWAMPRLSVQLYPEGVLQHVTSDKATTRGAKPTLKNETQEAAQAWRSDFDRAIMAIEKLLEPPLAIDETINVIPEQTYGEKYFSA